MLNNEEMGGLEIHDDSPEIDPVSPVILGSFLKYGLTEISTLTLTLTLTLTHLLFGSLLTGLGDLLGIRRRRVATGWTAAVAEA